MFDHCPVHARWKLTCSRQPRNARSKRALEKKAPKAQENPKTALFLRGTTCSGVVQDAIADLYSMRVPLAKKFTKKNAIHPFEDASSLEFFSEKNDTVRAGPLSGFSSCEHCPLADVSP